MTRLREALANRGFRRLRRRSAMQFSRPPESASANCRCPKRDWPRIYFLEEQTLHARGVGLLDQLQVEGDAHTVDEHHALVEQLLEGLARADEFDSFRSFLRRRKLVQHRKIKKLKFHIRRNPLGNVFEQRREKKIETLRGPPELQRILQRHLQRDLVMEKNESVRCVSNIMKFWGAFFRERAQL